MSMPMWTCKPLQRNSDIELRKKMKNKAWKDPCFPSECFRSLPEPSLHLLEVL